MSVKVRLTRTGANKDNCFRVVAADTRFPRDGRFIEILGWYDPKKTGKNFGIKLDRVEHWTSNGAKLSETVASLVKREKAATATAATANS
ncbi:MAG: 30S ribosomal protein S16 [Kiritimatiellaeota bacterium]|nr:30S ribosomal protein S16 [Kiritimatiellota bacterium]